MTRVLTLLLLALPAVGFAQDAETTAERPPALQVLALSGMYEDYPQGGGFDPTALLLGGGGKQKSFYKLCRYLDSLAADETLDHVLLDLSNPSLGMNLAQLEEIDRHLHRLKKSGKTLYAWLEMGSSVHYSLASACDRVVMADFGMLDLPSLALSTMHYKSAMDLLGVSASVVRAGDFKGAVEPYTEPRMSKHLKAHYVAMLSTMNDAMAERMSSHRGMTAEGFRKIQSKRLHTANSALDHGLVDQLAPFGGMEVAIKGHVGEETRWRTKAKMAKRQPSFFEIWSELMGVKPEKRLDEPGIAVLHLSGAIVDGKSPSPGSIVSGPMVDAIEKLEADDKVRAVVMRVNSPGGSATASEAIRQALVSLASKKPVVVSMGSVAASGGYWISCLERPILAEPTTITGSIGVFGLKLSFGTLMQRVGVHVENITLDDSAAAMSIDRAWGPDEQAMLGEFIQETYGRFLELVSDSRDMPRSSVEPLAGGRVWSGRQAVANGLVDELGGLDAAIARVAREAGLDESAPILHRPSPPNPFEMLDLFGGGGDDEVSLIPAGAWRLLRDAGFRLDTVWMLVQDSLRQEVPGVRAWLMHPEELRIR